MKVYYTLWSKSQLKMYDGGVEELITRCRSVGIHGLVVTVAMVYDGHTVNFVRDEYPLIGISEAVQSLLTMRREKFPYILKFQLHPWGDHYRGLNPQWWPNWLTYDMVVGIWIESAWTAIVPYVGRLMGYDPDVVIMGAEFDALARELKWNDVIRILRLIVPDVPITYGTNFWQPIRWKFWLPILLLHWCRKDREMLRQILEVGGLYQVAPEKLEFATNQIYSSLLTRWGFWRKLDMTGLSCYWYPSMLSPNLCDIQDSYLNYSVQLGGKKYDINYIQTVKDWVNYTGNPLIVTESGVLYNAPIARDKEAVKDWLRVTISYFREYVGAEAFCIWEDTTPGWVLEERLW